MPLDLQPTLVGPTVTVRPLTEGDRDAVYRAASDPLIWELHPANDRYQPGPFAEFFDGHVASGSAFVVETKAGEVVGATRFNNYDEHDSSVEIGWTFLARSQWGGATNREVKTLLLDHAFTGVDRVYFHVGPGNLRSRRAVEKLGATLVDGELVRGNVVYVLRKEDWVGGRGR